MTHLKSTPSSPSSALGQGIPEDNTKMSLHDNELNEIDEEEELMYNDNDYQKLRQLISPTQSIDEHHSHHHHHNLHQHIHHNNLNHQHSQQNPLSSFTYIRRSDKKHPTNYDETMNQRNGSGNSTSTYKDVYRPFQTPPDFRLAKLHGLAKKIGKIDFTGSLSEAGAYCVCCHLPFKKTPFKIGEDIEQYSSLGPAFTLFFLYVKQMIFLLCIYFLIGGWMNLVSTYSNCEDECESFLGMIYQRSGEKSCSDEFYTPQLLNFFAFWVLFVGVILCKIFQDRKEWRVTENQAKHSDFTLMISNVPETQCEEELLRFLQGNLELEGQDGDVNLPITFASINRVFRIQEYYRLASDKIKILNSYHALIRKQLSSYQKAALEQAAVQNNMNQSTVSSTKKGLLKDEMEQKKRKKEYQEKRRILESEMTYNQKDIQELEQRYSDYSSEEIRTSIVFVTFNSYAHCQAARNKYVHHHRFKHNVLTFKGRDLKFKDAKEPLDVIWENLEIPYKIKLFRRSISLAVALLLMLGSLIAVSAVTQWQKGIFDEKLNKMVLKHHSNPSSEEIRGYALSFSCTVIIVIINSILTVIVTLFSRFEKHNTFTEASVSISMRLSWIQFINTALVPFVMIVILTPSSDNSMSPSALEERNNEYLEYVTQNIFFIFIGNALLVPITVTFEIEYIYKKIRQWYFFRQNITCTKTQQQVNEIFEDPEFLVQEYYATTNRIVLSGFFYATMLSLGILIKCMTMVVLYWSFKFTFVRHSAYPKCLSNSLNSAMQMIMFFIPLIFTTGNIIYGWIFLKCNSAEIFSVYNIISLSFGVALIIFRSVFIRFFSLFTSDKQTHLMSFQEERKNMGLSYSQMNPISRAFDPENKQIELRESLQDQLLMQVEENLAQIDPESASEEIMAGSSRRNPSGASMGISAGGILRKGTNGQSQLQPNANGSQSYNSHDEWSHQNTPAAGMLHSVKRGGTILGIGMDVSIPIGIDQIRAKAHTSMIDYAFESLFLQRERQNQIISAAFERNQNEQRLHPSPAITHLRSPNLDVVDTPRHLPLTSQNQHVFSAL